MHYNCLSLGPARLDIFVQLPEDEVDEVCSIDRKKCMISMGFGEKIAVKAMNFSVGGNAGNNAVGLARFGLKTAMVGAMGDGWTDQKAREMLKLENVDLSYVQTNTGQNGFGVVLNYQEERTILSYYPDALCCFPDEDPDLSADWVYLTSMGLGFESFYQQAVSWALKHQAKIAFNPGTRQIKEGLEKLRFAYMNTDILFVNREEAALLTNKGIQDMRGLLAGLKSVGAKVVVITDGPAGTYCYDGKKFLHMPIINAPVIERTGAGDAFGSGFMAAVMLGKPLEEALQWGTVNSASVLGCVGPQAGLLTADKMPNWLERAHDVRVEELNL